METQTHLIIPAYNPSDGWEKILYERYVQFCDAIDFDIPLILVNDGSPKNIHDEVQWLREKIGAPFSYIHYEINKGKGYAIKQGADSVEGAWYIFTDIDFPYTTESMMTIYLSTFKNKGLITGFREEAYYADISVFRTVLSKLLRGLNKIILDLPTNDTQCGLKAFDFEVKKLLLKCQTDRFLIDLELMLATNNAKLPIHPTLVTLRDGVEFTKFNSSVLLKEVFNFFNLILKYRVFRKK